MDEQESHECEVCAGTGQSCGVHDTNDGCDCEDNAPMVQCSECDGTGQVENEEESE